MKIVSNHSGASWIFEPQIEKLNEILLDVEGIESVEVFSYSNPLRQEIIIEINESISNNPNEIFQLGMLVQLIIG